MFEASKTRQPYYMKRDILKKVGEDATAVEVLEYLLGTDCYDRTDYVLSKYDSNEKSIYSRLNLLWVFPLWLISIPFQWIIKGDIGVRRNSRIGKVIDYLIGLED